MTTYRDPKTGLWRYDVMVQGRRYTRRGYRTERAARIASLERAREVGRGLSEPFATFANLSKAWIESKRRRVTEQNLAHNLSQLNLAFMPLARKRPRDIRRVDIEAILSRVGARCKASTANSYRHTIKALMNYGVAIGALETNPAAGIPAIPEEPPSIRPIAGGDLQKLLLAADAETAAHMTFIAQTGCRWIESARLTWPDVYHDRPDPFAILTTRKSRGGAPRKRPQPLTRYAVRAIETMRGVHPRWVFPSPHGGQRRYRTDYARLEELCQRVGVPRYTWHQLRHWAGLIAAQAGKNRRAIAEFLGHTSVSVTDRYIHALAPEVWEIARGLEAQFEELGGVKNGVKRDDTGGHD